MPILRGYGFALSIVLVIILMSTAIVAQAASPGQDAVTGEQTFKAKCAACHSIGGGKLVGPDLKGVAARRDAGWLKNFIAAPDKVLASGDPLAAQLLKESNNVPMPNLGLSAREVDELLAYLAAKDGTATGAGGTTPPASVAVGQPALVVAGNGSAAQGRLLFMGQARLAQGGTACIACHSVAGSAALGGGALGPDLTQVHTRYGGNAGLAAALAGLPFPSMQSIYAARPLTADEQADLLAFFAAADQGQTPRPLANLLIVLGAGSGLAGVLFLGMMFFWPRQRLSMAQRLRQNGKL